MKITRLLLAGAVLGALLGNGCIITSAQILTHYSLTNPFTINSSAADHSELIPVDLTTVKDWNDHKDDLKGLTDLAITTLRQAADHAPTNPSVHYHLGLAQLKRGDKTAARQSIERALKINPAFPSATEAKQLLNTIKG